MYENFKIFVFTFVTSLCHIYVIKRTTERANPYFGYQRRKGHQDKGFTSLLVGTFDHVLDSKVCFGL